MGVSPMGMSMTRRGFLRNLILGAAVVTLQASLKLAPKVEAIDSRDKFGRPGQMTWEQRIHKAIAQALMTETPYISVL